MEFDNYKGKKFCNNTSFFVDDNLTVEKPLQITINNQTFSITMRTPGHDEDLVRGLLYTEDIYRGEENLPIQFTDNIEKNTSNANVVINEALLGLGYKNSRNLLSISSCGICGQKELADTSQYTSITDIKEDVLDIKTFYKMVDVMRKRQPTFHQSGGSHAAAVFSEDNILLCAREDIGRHNAVDKVIGFLINNKKIKKAKCIIVSGRISYEIVSKIFAAKIPILGAVSAPSTLSVDFAKELGVTLLGFCRENKATCYSHPQRIKN
ncbi:MAG: formate dehydrogenase family accessory protein FdhD [Bacteroidetes bacterium HGW-Bacteroidetes-12]|nr:MAG: formate dehydrogenase family accessory protein FdhD [Bacteroidetes bacterium HGW-Bacteroidetes-12]